MKQTFKQFLTESAYLPHWPKTMEELKAAFKKLAIDKDGEIFVDPRGAEFHADDMSVTVHGDARIYAEFLVDGYLPFKFREVKGHLELNTSDNKKFKSIKGVPERCGSFGIYNDCVVLDDLSECPRVYDHFVIQIEGVKSLKGLPQSLSGDGNYSLQCNNITDFSYLPKTANSLIIVKGNHFTAEDLQFLPESVGFLKFSSMPKLHSLHNIHKYVKECKEIGFYDTNLVKCILGLTMIKGLADLDLGFENDEFMDIMAKYTPEGDTFECQSELIDAGFLEAAKL